MISDSDRYPQEPQKATVQESLQMAMQSAVGYCQMLADETGRENIYMAMPLEFQGKFAGDEKTGFSITMVGPLSKSVFEAMNQAGEEILRNQ